MNARGELVERVARHRREQLGELSDAGFHELFLAVQEDVERFVDTPEDEAFLQVTKALERHDAACVGEDLLDDDAFFESRAKRMLRLQHDCEEALRTDPNCLDALLLRELARDLDPEYLLGPLMDVEHRAIDLLGERQFPPDAWDDLLLRPLLRIKFAIARTCFDSARYRMAAERCVETIALSPSDALGARYTCMLCYARLEDEQSLEELDVRFSRQGSAWSHLSRTILLYKLGRMPAARRALGGLSRLCEGGAYALLKPILIDTYLPDRPESAPLSFGEATLAVHEADPIIMDVPDFISWAQGQRDVWFSAQDFARKNDLDW